MFRFLVCTSNPDIKAVETIYVRHDVDVMRFLIKASCRYPKAYFFPLMNKENVEDVSVFISEYEKELYLREIEKSGRKYVFGIINKNEKIYLNVRRIEHVQDDIFNIILSEGSITTDDFRVFINILIDSKCVIQVQSGT